MKNDLPLPLPLLILFGVAAVAVVVMLLTIGPGSAATGGAPVLVRLRVVGPDGAPRAGVRLILRRNAAEDPVTLPPSGAGGIVAGHAPRGRYEVRVFPKKLATRAARRSFQVERRLTPRALENLQMLVGTIAAPTRGPDPVTLRLPVAASY
jgi:hypothetical protein